jgi:hypothetical protein
VLLCALQLASSELHAARVRIVTRDVNLRNRANALKQQRIRGCSPATALEPPSADELPSCSEPEAMELEKQRSSLEHDDTVALSDAGRCSKLRCLLQCARHSRLRTLCRASAREHRHLRSHGILELCSESSSRSGFQCVAPGYHARYATGCSHAVTAIKVQAITKTSRRRRKAAL